MYDLQICERTRVAKKIMEEMFQVKEGETISITADSGSRRDVVESLALAAHAAGGIPLVMQFPKARDNGQAGILDWPAKALTAALSESDVWIDAQKRWMLYSDIFEDAMKRNKNLRYLIIADSSAESLARVFGKVDVPMLGRLLRKTKELLESTHKIHVKTSRGTDVSFETEPLHLIDLDYGDYSKPKFGTAPGYVNVVPKFGSMEGNIVFDRILPLELSSNDHVEFRMERGRIVEFIGNRQSDIMKGYVERFNDENMFKISHMMIGLCPGVRELSGDIVEDERVWGGVDFGFGHTSPIDAPPNGQIAKSHFDGVMEKATIYFDGMEIVKDGSVVQSDLKPIADEILKGVLK